MVQNTHRKKVLDFWKILDLKLSSLLSGVFVQSFFKSHLFSQKDFRRIIHDLRISDIEKKRYLLFGVLVFANGYHEIFRHVYHEETLEHAREDNVNTRY